jgi:hypothetical protein
MVWWYTSATYGEMDHTSYDAKPSKVKDGDKKLSVCFIMKTNNYDLKNIGKQ